MTLAMAPGGEVHEDGEGELRHRATGDTEPEAVKNGKPAGLKTAESAAKVDSRAFISDADIKDTLVFKAFRAIFVNYGRIMHNYKVEGLENIPQGEGAIAIGPHSTHNVDIMVFLCTVYLVSGRMLRALVHRMAIRYLPVLRSLGAIPGYPGAAQDLLKAGYFIICAPGGAEEAMIGHENAYSLQWKSYSGTPRTGFARVALEAGKCKIVPIVSQNLEEMRFNPVYWAITKSGFPLLWDKVIAALTPYPKVQKFLGAVHVRLWLPLAMFSVPIPVNVRVIFLEPILVDASKDSLDEVVAKVRTTIQTKQEELQGGRGKNYTRALAQRGISLRRVQLCYAMLACVFFASLVLFMWPLSALIVAAVLFPFSCSVTVIPWLTLLSYFNM